MDIATQQATPAMQSRAWSEAGDKPSGRSGFTAAILACGAPAPDTARSAIAGGLPLNASASRGIESRQNTPVPM